MHLIKRARSSWPAIRVTVRFSQALAIGFSSGQQLVGLAGADRHKRVLDRPAQQLAQAKVEPARARRGMQRVCAKAKEEETQWENGKMPSHWSSLAAAAAFDGEDAGDLC